MVIDDISPKYKIVFTEKAKNELERIYEYISKEFKANRVAENLVMKMKNTIMRLERFPLSCESVRDIGSNQYRKLLVDNYIVFYIVNNENKSVIIARIIYGGMEYSSFL